MHSKIGYLEYYLPNKVVTNDDLSNELDGFKVDKALRIGIKQRHIASPEQTSVDLAYQVGKQILYSFDKDKIVMIMRVLFWLCPGNNEKPQHLYYPPNIVLIQLKNYLFSILA